jgi:hypothetical protein
LHQKFNFIFPKLGNTIKLIYVVKVLLKRNMQLRQKRKEKEKHATQLP